MENKNVPKVSFFDAAVTLADLCDKVDDAQEIDKSLIEQFEDAKLTLQQSIDRRKHVYKECEARIALARSYKKDLDDAIRRLQKVQERIEQNTKSMIELKPDLPYQDTIGNKISIRKNSQPALKYSFDLRASKSFQNILDPESIQFLDIDPKYIKEISFFVLDTEKLKKDLADGLELPWASLEWGTHVRGLST